MGNLVSDDFSKHESEEDPSFLNLQSTAFFNDTFISTLVSKLPAYGFVEDDEKSTQASIGLADDHNFRMHKMLAVLSPDSEQRHSKVEDFEELDMIPLLSKSKFHAMNSKRSRVLLRVFHVSSICTSCFSTLYSILIVWCYILTGVQQLFARFSPIIGII
jgi:hypothetical protein